jgi:NADPH:quinone reductase-like Zn-dependent oxidoreductase
VAVPNDMLAPIPDALDFARAATLPVAGLTATRTLAAANVSPHSRVLITAAAGGVGRFAIQLAAHEGATVTAVVGSPPRVEGLAELGADEVLVGMPEPRNPHEDAGAGRGFQGEPEHGEYDVILESVGGTSLAAALELVAQCGTVVSFGNASREPTTFDASTFYARSGARLYAFRLLPELARLGTACNDLSRLAAYVTDGHIDAQVDLEVDWAEAGAAAGALLDRRVNGKAVLRVGA